MEPEKGPLKRRVATGSIVALHAATLLWQRLALLIFWEGASRSLDIEPQLHGARMNYTQ